MQQSGTKLVAALVLVAIALGVVSWWYRYESAHRATRFWGPDPAQIISQPDRIDWFHIADEENPGNHSQDRQSHEVTGMPGMVHLRHNLMTDGNYDWNLPVVAEDIAWRWGLWLAADDVGQVWVLFDERFETVGRQLEEGGPIDAVAATGMSEALREYFSSRGLTAASTED